MLARVATLLAATIAAQPEPYTVHTLQQPCTHSDFSVGAPTFAQRWLMSSAHWHNGTGPVLFYAGNEGAIEGFASATGWQWTLAREIGALVVFAEHRGYGHSAASPSSCGTGFRHVTSAGALSDFVALAAHLRSSWGAANSTIVAVGGRHAALHTALRAVLHAALHANMSHVCRVCTCMHAYAACVLHVCCVCAARAQMLSYGGMLAAWLRLRYGHQFDGAIAASAPIALGHEWDRHALYGRVSHDYPYFCIVTCMDMCMDVRIDLRSATGGIAVLSTPASATTTRSSV